jgi:hypothetical protein
LDRDSFRSLRCRWRWWQRRSRIRLAMSCVRRSKSINNLTL